jgi:hypothetical protein
MRSAVLCTKRLRWRLLQIVTQVPVTAAPPAPPCSRPRCHGLHCHAGMRHQQRRERELQLDGVTGFTSFMLLRGEDDFDEAQEEGGRSGKDG